VGTHPHPAEVEPIGVPAGADGRVDGGAALCVVADGVLEEGEAIGAEGEEVRDEGAEHVRGARPVVEVAAVVAAARVVEDGEEADDGLVGAGFSGQLEAEIFYPPPVVRAVDRVRAEGEDRLGVVADADPLLVGDGGGAVVTVKRDWWDYSGQGLSSRYSRSSYHLAISGL